MGGVSVHFEAAWTQAGHTNMNELKFIDNSPVHFLLWRLVFPPGVVTEKKPRSVRPSTPYVLLLLSDGRKGRKFYIQEFEKSFIVIVFSRLESKHAGRDCLKIEFLIALFAEICFPHWRSLEIRFPALVSIPWRGFDCRMCLQCTILKKKNAPHIRYNRGFAFGGHYIIGSGTCRRRVRTRVLPSCTIGANSCLRSEQMKDLHWGSCERKGKGR